jgi:hypothetical protein
VLLALLEDSPKPLSRGDIQARSGNRVGEGGAVEVHVHHLRRKLGRHHPDLAARLVTRIPATQIPHPGWGGGRTPGLHAPDPRCCRFAA